ncbi:MAG: hypothetical protein M3081_19630 [Gemmatimonadota bacterium]|nr:hypothetical protein [Gemmatimonadota bacterium]
MSATIAIESKARVDWSAAAWAGIIAGLVFMALEMMMVAAFLGNSPWGPPRMIAAIVMGKGVLPMPGGSPPTFDAGVLAAAMMVHFVLSIIFAMILAFAIAGRTYGAALAIGAVTGLLLYLVNFYLFTGIFPWFAMARNWVTIFSHVAFGLVAAMVYWKLSRRTEGTQTA